MGEANMNLPEFYPDMRVEVLTMHNRLIFVGRIQKVEDDALQIQEESDDRLPYVEYNSEVKLRGFSYGEAFTVAGMIGGSTQFWWKVDRLRTLQAREKREYFRQNISIDADVMCVNEIFDRQRQNQGGAGRVVPCKILDVSAGGMRIRCEMPYLEGDWLFVQGVILLEKEPSFSFACKIMRASVHGSIYEYGCMFCDLDPKEQERLIRAILMLQRRELQARRS